MDLFADFEARARRVLATLPAEALHGLDPSRIAVRPPRPREKRGDSVVIDLSGLRDRPHGEAPQGVAAELARHFATDPDVSTVAVAQGYVDLRLTPRYLAACLASALAEAADFGRGRAKAPILVTLSRGADQPTARGPDRVPIVAAAIAGLLAFAGHPVSLEPEGGPRSGRPEGRADIGLHVLSPPGSTAPGRSRSLAIKPCRLATATAFPTAGATGEDAEALRFAILSHRADKAVTLDPALVTDRSHAGPLFHVRYAHARIRAVLRDARQRPSADAYAPAALATSDFTLLVDPGERALAEAVLRFPHVAAVAADRAEPHRLAQLLRDLSGAVHHQWNRSKDQPQLRFVNEEQRDLTQARLGLMTASALVLTSGLGIFGIEAPEEMR